MGGGSEGKGHGGGRRYAFKVLCPDLLVISMLGLRGARKEQIQEETGCKIVISGRDEYFPGTRYRTLLALSDRPDALLAALERLVVMVVDCAAQETSPPSGSESDFHGTERGQYVLRIAVTRSMSSAIIGPRGANVRGIREETGAKVVVDTAVSAGQQVAKVLGNLESLSAGLAAVNRIIQQDYGTAPYEDWVSASIPSFGGPGHEQRRERSPRRLPPAPPVPRPPSAPAVIPPPRKVSLDEGDAPNSPEHFDADGHDDGVDQSLLQALGAVIPEFPPGTLDMEYTISCEFPKEKVSLLIGRKGENVQEIRKATGARIHFEPLQEGSDGQTLNIKGPLLQTYRAHALLMKKYHECEPMEEEPVEEPPPPVEEPSDPGADRVKAIQEQLNALQKQLAEVANLRLGTTTSTETAAPASGSTSTQSQRKGGKGHGKRGR